MNYKTIAEAMSPLTEKIVARMSLSEALQVMKKANIHHLPVVDLKGQAIGIVSERDLNFGCSVKRSSSCTVGDVMTPEPYIVQKEANLKEVIDEMIARKVSSAIVVDDLGCACGIYTLTDLTKSLDEYLWS